MSTPVFLTTCMSQIAQFVRQNYLCVSLVMEFQPMLAYWFEDMRLPKLREEHGSVTNIIEELTGELSKLAKKFAQTTGWKVYTERKLARHAMKRTHEGRGHPKTILEELSSTNDSSSDDGLPPQQRPEDIPDNPIARELASIRRGGNLHALDIPTKRFVDQHVQEFLRERLHPTKKVKDALAWSAVNEPRWPMVAAIAKHSLCVPTSVCSERAFSATGHLVRARRSRLSDEKIEELSHLSYNLDPQ